jgi:limonene-1,2-epoxide hydrolase
MSRLPVKIVEASVTAFQTHNQRIAFGILAKPPQSFGATPVSRLASVVNAQATLEEDSTVFNLLLPPKLDLRN